MVGGRGLRTAKSRRARVCILYHKVLPTLSLIQVRHLDQKKRGGVDKFRAYTEQEKTFLPDFRKRRPALVG